VFRALCIVCGVAGSYWGYLQNEKHNVQLRAEAAEKKRQERVSTSTTIISNSRYTKPSLYLLCVNTLEHLFTQLEYKQFLQVDREKMAKASKLAQDMKQDIKAAGPALNHTKSNDKPKPDS
jgi:hypothetical protein